MKNFAIAFLLTLGFMSAAHASDDWTEVVSTTLISQGPDYKDILIHKPGTYSEARVAVAGGKARIDRFDIISHVLWGKQVYGLEGVYTSDMSRTASFSHPSQVRFVRIYAESMPLGMPIPIRVWMR